MKTLASVKAGSNPDAIVFDPATKRVFTLNGGKPEFAVADGTGNIYVNIQITRDGNTVDDLSGARG